MMPPPSHKRRPSAAWLGGQASEPVARQGGVRHKHGNTWWISHRGVRPALRMNR